MNKLVEIFVRNAMFTIYTLACNGIRDDVSTIAIVNDVIISAITIAKTIKPPSIHIMANIRPPTVFGAISPYLMK